MIQVSNKLQRRYGQLVQMYSWHFVALGRTRAVPLVEASCIFTAIGIRPIVPDALDLRPEKDSGLLEQPLERPLMA